MKKIKIKKLLVYLLVFSMLMLVSGCAATPKPAPAEAPATEETLPAEEPASEEFPAAEMPAEEAAPEEDYDSGNFNNSEATGESGESYLEIAENKDVNTDDNSMLTFSLKVDTASYNNVERYIENGQLPPQDAVKTEELINYFKYDEVLPETDEPFSVYTEIGDSPFDSAKKLAFVRVKAKDIDKTKLPPSNLTFLIDSSGSMDSYDKLPLLKSAFSLLVENLNEGDTVSIVTYAGSSEIVLDSAKGNNTRKILDSINKLSAGGSTAGADGINTAYKLAEKNFVKGGNNRIILATDGDFNVGISDLEDLEKLISKKRESGVYLSILGFGTGNLQDDIMETLSKNGNGNYAYINSIRSAQKVLVDELSGNLFAIADDVKAQVEFNPENVASYRLIGYENRRLRNEDFENDKKDAGEIGVGTDVAVMFEIELKGNSGLKYSSNDEQNESDYSDELFEVRIRYKDPGEAESKLILTPVKMENINSENSTDFYFAASVASFGHLLRDSEYAGNITLEDIISTAKSSRGEDKEGYRKEFIKLLGEYSDIAD